MEFVGPGPRNAHESPLGLDRWAGQSGLGPDVLLQFADQFLRPGPVDFVVILVTGGVQQASCEMTEVWKDPRGE